MKTSVRRLAEAAAVLALGLSSMALAQLDPDEDQEFEEGDKVQISINERMWQDCEIIQATELMRLKCKPYTHVSGYTRAGGIYVMTSRKPKDIRRMPQAQGENGMPAGAMGNPATPN